MEPKSGARMVRGAVHEEAGPAIWVLTRRAPEAPREGALQRAGGGGVRIRKRQRSLRVPVCRYI